MGDFFDKEMQRILFIKLEFFVLMGARIEQLTLHKGL